VARGSAPPCGATRRLCLRAVGIIVGNRRGKRRTTIAIYERLLEMAEVARAANVEQPLEFVWGVGVARRGGYVSAYGEPVLERLIEIEVVDSSGTEIRIRPRAVGALPNPRPANPDDWAHVRNYLNWRRGTEFARRAVEPARSGARRVLQKIDPKPKLPRPKLQQVADRTTARPTKVAKLSNVSAAPSTGAPSAEPSDAQRSWIQDILVRLGREKRYPSEAQQQGLDDYITVRFVLDRRGKVLSARIVHSNGYAPLDAEALALFRRVTLPPMPDEMKGETFDKQVGLHFFPRRG
jgi:TonB family protein